MTAPLVAVPILRAGLGMLDPIVELFPDVSVGYIGLERDEETAVAASYYAKLPPSISGQTVFVLDPMLATGGSAAHAIQLVKDAGAGRVKMLCIVAAPEGVAHLDEKHPDVAVYTGALDRQLNERKYILPGLGDFGDRLYGTFPT
jgi:uracil phosphoribosyltransferase